MKLPTILALAPLVTANPVKRTNSCGVSTFENRISNGSPSVADCQQLAYNIRGDGSWNHVGNPGQHRTLATFGTCVFGVEADPHFGRQSAFRVGNEDIIDLIRDSISLYQGDGRVGTRGIMMCGNTQVLWGIYHTK